MENGFHWIKCPRTLTGTGREECVVRWVLWFKNDKDEKYTLRKGRYATKTAAEDAVKNLALEGVKVLILPEDVEPQANRSKPRM